MNIEKVNSAQSFQGLNIKKVVSEHRHFIESDFEKLKELSDKYDISMKSIVNSEFRCDGITITVKELKDKFHFFQRPFRPEGKSYFYTTKHYTADTKEMTLLGQIQKAIENLNKNTISKTISP